MKTLAFRLSLSISKMYMMNMKMNGFAKEMQECKRIGLYYIAKRLSLFNV